MRSSAVERENDEEKAMRTLQDDVLRQAEDGGRGEEALFQQRLEGEDLGLGGKDSVDPPSRRQEVEVDIREPLSKMMSNGDRRRAQRA